MQSGNQAAVQESLSALSGAVLRAIAYSDVFDHPLTANEVWRALPLAASLKDTRAQLDAEVGARRLEYAAPYYVLPGRSAITEVRERRARSSEMLQRRAKFWGRVIGSLPFVRMVAVTGSLAVESAEADEDIDYLIVTKRGRVWTARGFTIAVVRAARLTGVELCPNFVLADNALTLAERDAYVARELVQMVPVAGRQTAIRMLDENAWWHDYLPNAVPASLAATEARGPSFLRRLPERLLGGGLGDRIEHAILRRKGDALRRDAGNNPEARFDESMCKGHVDGHRSRIAEALAVRLEGLGLEP